MRVQCPFLKVKCCEYRRVVRRFFPAACFAINSTAVTGHEVTRQRKAALQPLKCTATVSIPKSYFLQVYQLRNPPPDGEEPEELTTEFLAKVDQFGTAEILPEIQSKVAKILPEVAAGEDQYQPVEVSSYDDLPVEDPAPPTFATKGMSWFSTNWQTLGLFVVGLVSLFVLRGMIRAASPPPLADVPEEVPEVAPVEEVEEEEEELPVALQRRAAPTGGALRDELTAMVREDPDAAANVLRTWIGDAA